MSAQENGQLDADGKKVAAKGPTRLESKAPDAPSQCIESYIIILTTLWLSKFFLICISRVNRCSFSHVTSTASQASTSASSVAATELEIDAHDDDDVYPSETCQEHGEEEQATEDEYVEVEAHTDAVDEDCMAEKSEPEGPAGTAMDTMDTLPQPDGPIDEHLESDGEMKGARKVEASCTPTFIIYRYIIYIC